MSINNFIFRVSAMNGIYKGSQEFSQENMPMLKWVVNLKRDRVFAKSKIICF